jgi:hypothetical protein
MRKHSQSPRFVFKHDDPDYLRLHLEPTSQEKIWVKHEHKIESAVFAYYRTNKCFRHQIIDYFAC